MAYLIFIDESGYNTIESPYAVLAGVAIKDRDLWNVVTALQEAEMEHFGRRLSGGQEEIKARKLLKRKTYRLAAQLPPIPPVQRRGLAKQCLDQGETGNRRQITALAQAKLDYVGQVLNICSRFGCRAFASIVDQNSPQPDPNVLRKDYSYLFERFFYFLEAVGPEEMGIVVFDELEKTQCQILLDQMDHYFKSYAKGIRRSARIIPEPFFVHSEMTTGVQLADVVAYIVSWGFRRITGMTEPERPELADLVNQVCQLRYQAVTEVGDNPNFQVWSFVYIEDLRGADDRV